MSAERIPQLVPSGQDDGEHNGDAASLDALLDVTLPVVIEIGRASMTVQEVLQLAGGSVIQLNRLVGEPVDVYVSDRRLAQGEVVVVGEHFGVRITRVLASPGAEAGA
ncbi:MAG: flagellar motor switch protein FliN [Candidatus Eiseniibacteriota bacterium]